MTREQDNARDWVLKIGGFIMSIALMVSSWFLNQAWNRIQTIENKVQQLELQGAATSGNRFTSIDWQTNKAILDNERLALDRRMIKQEEMSLIIKDSLMELKTNVNQLLNENRNK